MEHRHSIHWVVESKLQVVPRQAIMLCFSMSVASLTVSSGMAVFPYWRWVVVPLAVPECPSKWMACTSTALSTEVGQEVLDGIVCQRTHLLLGGRKAVTSSVSLAKARVISFILLSRKEHTLGHGKEEPSFNALPLFSFPFCGIGLAISKAPCHSHSQSAHFCMLLCRETVSTVLAHDKESLICSKVFWD